jgi:hypothetical protein
VNDAPVVGDGVTQAVFSAEGSSWVSGGSDTQINEGSALLTESASNQSGGILYDESFARNEGVRTRFEFQADSTGATPGDGFALIFFDGEQIDGSNFEIGGAGGGLGAYGLDHTALTIGFDSYTHDWVELYDANDTHLGQVDVANMGGIDGIGFRSVEVELTADNFLNVNMSWDGGTTWHAIYENYDLAANGITIPDNVKFGYTAATGGAWQEHLIQNVEVESIAGTAINEVDAGDVYIINASDLLVNASDVDHADSELSVANLSVTDPAMGVVVDNGDGTFGFTASETFSGTAEFSYDVSDGEASTPASNYTLNITNTNDAPDVSASIAATVDEDTSITLTQDELLANASDLDGNTLTASNVQIVGADAAVVDNGDGTFTITPSSNFSGDVDLTFDVSDGTETTAATGTVTVDPIADAPDVDINTTDSVVFATDNFDSSVSGWTGTNAYLQGSGFGTGNALTMDSASGVISKEFTVPEGAQSVTLSFSAYEIESWDGEEFRIYVNDEVYVTDSFRVNDAESGTETVFNQSGEEVGTVVHNTEGNFVGYAPWLDQAHIYTIEVPINTATGTVKIGFDTDLDEVSSNERLQIDSLSLSANYEGLGDEDTAIALDFSATLTDLDGDEQLSISLSDVPEGAILSAGTFAGNGVWELEQADLIGLTLTPPSNFNGTIDLTVNAVSTHISNGDTATTTDTLTVVVDAIADSVGTISDDNINANSVDENALAGTVVGITALATDPDGDTVTYSLHSDGVGNAYSGPFEIHATTGAITVRAGYSPDELNHEVNPTQSVFVTETSSDGSEIYENFTVNVNDINEAPEQEIATPLAATEDVSFTFSNADLLQFTSDPDGDALTVSNVAYSGNDGAITSNGNGTYVFTPTANFNGNVNFTFDASDGSTTTNISADIDFAAVNDAASASANATAATDEDGSILLTQADLLANASDVDGDTLTASNVTLVGSDATLTDNLDGTYTVTPDANFNGNIDLNFDIDDGTTTTASVLNLTVNAINDAPVAVDDGTLGSTLVLDGSDSLLVQVASNPSNGQFTASMWFKVNPGDSGAQGLFTAGTQAYTGADRSLFLDDEGNLNAYTWNGSAGNQTIETNVGDLADGEWHHVTYSLNGTQAQVFIDGEIAATGSLGVTAFNWSDAIIIGDTSQAPSLNGEIRDVQVYTGYGADAVDAQNMMVGETIEGEAPTFRHEFNGDNPFLAEDVDGPIATTITGNPAIEADYLADGVIAADDVVTYFDVLANDSDIESGFEITGLSDAVDADGNVLGSLSIVEIDGVQQVQFMPDGNILNLPEGEQALGSFTYTITDAEGATDTATVAFNFEGTINYAAVVQDQAFSTAEDNNIIITDEQLLAGASDINGDNLSVESVSYTGTDGVLTDNGDGTHTFAPNENFNGDVNLSFAVNDGTTTTNANIDLNVASVNDAPVVTNIATAMQDEEASMVIDPAVLVNSLPISDADGDTLTITDMSYAGSDGTFVANGDGTYTLTGGENFVGTMPITYTVEDGNGGSTTGTINFDIANVNDAPSASANATAATDEDGSILLTQADLLANASDIDGDTLTASNVTLVGSDATLTDNLDGTYTVTPDANFNGNIDLNFDIDDGTTTTASALNLTVNAVNDAPTTTGNITATVNEDATITLTQAQLLANATDVDGDALTATNPRVLTALFQPANGSVVDNGDGTFTITPDPDYNGTIQISYSISDASQSITSRVILSVDPVNDAPDSVTNTYNATEDQTIVLSDADLLTNATDLEGDAISVTNVSYAGTDATFEQTAAIEFGADTNNRIEIDTRLDSYDAFTMQVEYTALGTPSGSMQSLISAPTSTANQNHFNLFINNPDGSLDGHLFGDYYNFSNSPDFNDGGTHEITIGWDSASGVLSAFDNGVLFDSVTIRQGNTMGAGGYAIIGQEQDTYGGSFDGNQAVTDSLIGHFTMSYDRVSNADIETGAELADLSNDLAFDVRMVNDIVVDASPTASSLTLAGDLSSYPQYEFTPNENFNGDISFDVEYSDGVDVRTVNHTIDFAPVNDAPTASTPADTLINSDQSITYTEAELVANASDTDGDTLSVQSVSYAGSDGSLVDNGNGTWTFTPNADFGGNADLDVTISDGTSTIDYTQTVDVNVAVTAVDDGRDDSGLISTMSSNTGVFGGQNVTVSAHNEHTSSYAAYKAVDGVDADPSNNANSWAGNILAPSGTGQTIGWYQVDLGQQTTLYQYDLKAIVANQVGREAKDWTFEGSDDGANWTTLDTVAGESNWGSSEVRSFELDEPATFQYFRFNITANNGDATWVGFDGFQMYTMVTVEESEAAHDFDVLANDIDLDGDTLSITNLSDAIDSNGNVVGTIEVVNVGGTEQVRFTPNGSLANGVSSAVSFDYTVSDGRSTSTETVNFFLKGEYSEISSNGAVEAEAIDGVSFTLSEAEMTANIDNPEGATLTVGTISFADGSVVDNGDSTYSFTPNAGVNGIANITYDVSDGTTTVAASTDVSVRDELLGSMFDDTITGTIDEELIQGLIGGDTLDGAGGNDVLVGGAGNDTLTGGTGADTFRWEAGDEGTAATPAQDVIGDFEVGVDHIDLADFLSGHQSESGTELANVIELREDNGNMVLSIKSDGANVDQELTIENVSIDDMYGGTTSGLSESDILQKMIDDQNLIS